MTPAHVCAHPIAHAASVTHVAASHAHAGPKWPGAHEHRPVVVSHVPNVEFVQLLGHPSGASGMHTVTPATVYPA